MDIILRVDIRLLVTDITGDDCMCTYARTLYAHEIAYGSCAAANQTYFVGCACVLWGISWPAPMDECGWHETCARRAPAKCCSRHRHRRRRCRRRRCTRP